MQKFCEPFCILHSAFCIPSPSLTQAPPGTTFGDGKSLGVAAIVAA